MPVWLLSGQAWAAAPSDLAAALLHAAAAPQGRLMAPEDAADTGAVAQAAGTNE
jgi:hypothetical protein